MPAKQKPVVKPFTDKFEREIKSSTGGRLEQITADSAGKFSKSDSISPFKKQKQVVKPKAKFTKDPECGELGGNSKPSIYNKAAKNGYKKFVIKEFKSPVICALEKLAYDLLQLCGVRVPKTYIVENDQKKLASLASRFEPGYKDLKVWLGSPDPALIKDQKLNGKPIKGLFENYAIFAFLQDWDVVGITLENVGLIEHTDYFEVVKIDPGNCNLPPDSYMLNQYLSQLCAESPGYYPGDRGNNSKIFSYSTKEQKLEGMQRIANLTDEQLKNVIYNSDLPGLPLTIRERIYDGLITGRNAYRRVLEEMGLYLSVQMTSHGMLNMADQKSSNSQLTNTDSAASQASAAAATSHPGVSITALGNSMATALHLAPVAMAAAAQQPHTAAMQASTTPQSQTNSYKPTNP